MPRFPKVFFPGSEVIKMKTKKGTLTPAICENIITLMKTAVKDIRESTVRDEKLLKSLVETALKSLAVASIEDEELLSPKLVKDLQARREYEAKYLYIKRPSVTVMHPERKLNESLRLLQEEEEQK